jgi:signal recognition particle subunit SRP54
MFEALTEKLTAVFQRLSNKGRLTEKDVTEALREVRLALLEADVNLKVIRDFLERVRQRCIGKDVLESLTPGQQVVKIVHEELIAVLSGGDPKLSPAPSPPTVVMLVGLQGSGKTTTCAKLALHLRRQGHRALLVAADLKRPAAVEQLVTLGKQLDIPVYSEGLDKKAGDVCHRGVARARELGMSWVILDTAGRLHIDEEMMTELVEVKKRTVPHEALLVVDAMTGQDAVRVAQDFHAKVGLTGLILTKLDGDARGGAALSVTSVTGVPIKFVGVGEKADALEQFHPDRMASRILGMGDVLTLIEKAQATIDEKQAQEMQRKLRTASFTLEDFLGQLQQLKKMGPLSQLLEMLPGIGTLAKRMPSDAMDEKQLKKVEAIIFSMTQEERRRPEILDGSRKRRIARGSGTTPADVNLLLNQFKQSQTLMQRLAKGKLSIPGMPRLPKA